MSERRSFGFTDELFKPNEALQKRYRVDGVVSSAYIAIGDTIRFTLKQTVDEQIVQSKDFEARVTALHFNKNSVVGLSLNYEPGSMKFLKLLLQLTPFGFIAGGQSAEKHIDAQNFYWISISEPNPNIPLHEIADGQLS